MNTDKCFCHLNGYAVKDAKARQDIEALQETITALDTAYNNLIVVTESYRSRIEALEAAVAELAASSSQGASLMKINLEPA